MKRFVKASALVLSLALLSACAAPAQQAATANGATEGEDTAVEAPAGEVRVLQLGHLGGPNSTWHIGLEYFADRVYEYTGGEVQVQVFHSETLGPEVDVINSIHMGTADMVVSAESMQGWAPILGVMAAPYLIQDSEHMHRVLGSEVGEMFEREIYEGVGLVVLTYFERGPRLLTSNRPVHNLADLQGMNVRIPNVPLFVNTWSAWGASPVTMAFGEVFTSLQSGVIEAQENPLALIHSASFQEVQAYLNNTAHVRSWIYLLIGANQWHSLTPAQQEAIQRAADEAQAYENALFLEEEEELFTLLTEHYGMTFIETDQQEFAQAIMEFYMDGGLTDEELEVFMAIDAMRD